MNVPCTTRIRAQRPCLAVAASLVIAAWAGSSAAAKPSRTAAGEARRSAPIVLVIGSLPPGVDEADLRARLSRELGAPLTDAAAPGQIVRGTLHLDAGDGDATARFEGPDGNLTQRTVPVPSGRERAGSALVALSGNVARDESAALREEILRRGARRRARPSPGASSAPDPSPEAEPEDPEAEEPAAEEPEEPSTERPPRPFEPPSPEEPRAITHIVCRPAPGQASFFAGADLVPMLGTSLASRDAVLGASLNVVGGLSGGVRGLQIGSVFNLVRGSVCGLQIGGAVNVTRDVAGLQLGGAVNVTRDVLGVQIGGASNIARDVRGLQVGGAVNVTRDVAGLQLGGASNIARDVRGLQVGGAVNVTRDVRGLQVGGAFNVARDVSGLQLGGAVNVTRDVAGLQLGGAVNVTRDVAGLQLGAVNIAGRVRGVQIGAVNVADDSSFSLGVVSIVRRGRSHLDVWGAETGLLTAAFKHGGRYFHNYYGAGIRPLDDKPRVAFTLGVGGHIPLSSRLFLDIDALANSLHRTDDFGASPTFLAQARSVVGLRVASGLAIAAGPSYNVSFAGTDEAATLSLLGSTSFASGASLFIRGWPGFSLGLQVF